MSAAAISGGAFLAVWVLSGKITTRMIWQPWMVHVLLLMAFPWIGLLYTSNVHNGMTYAQKSYYWLFAFAAAVTCSDRYPASRLPKAFVLGLSLSSIVSLLQYAGIVPLKKGMPIALFYWHQTYSLLLAFGVAITSWFIFKSERYREKLLFLALFAVILAALAIVPGRAGYLVFLLTVPFIAYNFLSKKNLFRIAIFCIMVGGLLFVSPVVHHRINEGLNDITAYKSGNINTSLGLRFYFWRSAADMILEHPLLGLGTGGFEEGLKKFKTDPALPDSSQPHNSFVYLAVSFGIFSLIPFVWLLFSLFRQGWRHRNGVVGFSIFSCAMMMLVGSMFDSQLIMNGTGVLFALFIGLQENLREG